ncbi:MAG: ATP-dependent zinc metalloprotease FtsH, partial [Oscillospiraceae bacterium]|nr:ATP-dependent zinc metalloprotease FtsH [Oscillospiraceae bacterium]
FMLMTAGENVTERKYSEIVSYFDNYQVEEYTLDLGNGSGTGKLTMKIKGKENEIVYTVPHVSIFIDDVNLSEYREEYNAQNPDKPLVSDLIPIKDNSLLISTIPMIILIGLTVILFVVMMRQASGGGKMNNFSKANAKTLSASGKKTTFADVAGADEEKEEMAEIVDFLKNPRKYKDIGARIPHGALLVGPPGTGKTLLAKAVAGEAGVPFFSISGSDFVEMFVGVGASRVRDLFETAKKQAPSIIFIDEIDAVGRRRGAGLGGGHDEKEQTLNQILVEMDGFDTNDSVIVIAATNRKDILDPALMRPGRFDRHIFVNYPDVKGREDILKVHTRTRPLAPDVDLKVIAKTTQGFTGADLENLVNEAALLAARKNRKAITEEDIEEATIKVIAGPEKKSHVVTERDRKITSFHEAGHAVAAYYLETQEKVQQVTVIQRGMAAGLTITRPETDDRHVTRTYMKESIVMLLGGRVAEEIALDDISTGASNDIERATKTARNMIMKYGFSNKIGPVVYGSDSDEVFLGRDYGHTQTLSDKVASEIDDEVKRLIDEAHEQCKKILTDHRDKLDLVAKYLIHFEKIDSELFEKLMNGEVTDEDVEKKIAEELKKKEENVGEKLDVTVSDEVKDNNAEKASEKAEELSEKSSETEEKKEENKEEKHSETEEKKTEE